MSKIIEQAKEVSDLVNVGKSHISSNLKELLIALTNNANGVIIELPWNCEIEGKFTPFITVLLVKLTKERVYFINPIKISELPCEIKAEDRKGFPRRIEKDGIESFLIVDLLKANRTKPISGIIRDK